MKRICVMLFLFCSLQSFGQLTISSSGNVSIATEATPQSTLSINSAGYSYSDVYVSSSKIGVLSRQYGNGAYGWGYALNGETKPYGSSFCVGVIGTAYSKQANYAGRTFGVFGEAGNATAGWNYGVFGRLKGTVNGAAIYGTTVGDENGTDVGGVWAGYFNGDTKVVGDLTVTGSINGVVLGSAASSASNSKAITSVKENVTDDYIDKLEALNVSSFYLDNNAYIRPQSISKGDTLELAKEMGAVEKQTFEKLHYGLDAEQMKEVFPDLVYELEDGSQRINYMEMVPILIQTISGLNARIKELESACGINSTKAVSKIAKAADTETVQLCQNTPNPFNESSSISMTIPESASSAVLSFYDASGKPLKQEDVSGTGSTTVTINASDFNPGIYLYSLVVDGKLISTKRMIVSR